MTIPEILKTRLNNLLLDAPVPKTPADIAAHLCAMQAQDFAAAKWSIGLRNDTLTDADVEKALAEKSLIRTTSLRGTLHFMHRNDVRWITRIARERMLVSNANALKK